MIQTRPDLAFTLIVISLVGPLIYWPGLSGGFAFDDFANIVHNARLHLHSFSFDALWQAAWSHSGHLGRPMSMATFALNHLASGPAPFAFKLTNVLLHTLNGILVFFLAASLLNRLDQGRYVERTDTAHQSWLALLIAIAWLAHPINLSPALYIVQRMTSLAAFFMLLALLAYLGGRSALVRGERKGWWLIGAAISLLTPLAVFSKETGALAPVLMFIVEISVLRFEVQNRIDRRVLITLFFILLVVLPIAGFIAMFGTDIQHFAVSRYQLRDFSLGERLLSEGRALWLYLKMIIIPQPGDFGLFHDDFKASRGWLVPTTTLPAIVGIGLLIATAVFSLKHYPPIAFGILFFLAGHLLESTVFPLELVHEHRNYLPSFGVIFALFYTVLDRSFLPRLLPLRRFFAIAIMMVFALLTLFRASDWGNPLGQAQAMVAHHPESARSHQELAGAYVAFMDRPELDRERLFKLSEHHFQQASLLEPASADGPLGLLVLYGRAGHELGPALMTELETRLATPPFRASYAVGIISVSRCMKNRECTFDEDILRAHRASGPTE